MLRPLLRDSLKVPSHAIRSLPTVHVARASSSSAGSSPAKSRLPEPSRSSDTKAPPFTAPMDSKSSHQDTFSDAPLVRESFSDPEELNLRPLPFLSFAPGVVRKPEHEPVQAWYQRRRQLLQDEERMAKRKAIVKEATRGYFHDFHAIKSHGGKTWRAPNTLIRDQMAHYWPSMKGTRLSDRKSVDVVDLVQNKITILALLGTQISVEHTKSFYDKTYEQYRSNPDFQLIQLNLQQNSLKSFLVRMTMSALKKQMDPSLHATYILSGQNMELEKDDIGFHNKHVGYTYLIDRVGKIRWAGCAYAEPAEVQALSYCTQNLVDRTGS